MGCPCRNGESKAKQSYKVKNPDGTSETFTSEPDARLAAAKSGGKVVRVSR